MDLSRQEKIFCSGTFWGENLGLVAARETLLEFQEQNVADHLQCVGTLIKDIYNRTAKKLDLKTSCIGYPTRLCLKFDDIIEKSFFLERCLDNGVLFSTVVFPMFMHKKKEINRAEQVITNALYELSDAIRKGDVKEQLKGDIVKLPPLSSRFETRF